MIEAFLIVLFTNSALIMLMSGTDLVHKSVPGLIRIYTPFSEITLRIIPVYFLSNIVFSFVTMLLLAKRCEQYVKLLPFEMRNRNRGKMWLHQKIDMFKYLSAVVLSKVISDIFVSLCFGDRVFFFHMEFDFFVTVMFWLEGLYLLSLIGFKTQTSLFIIFALDIISVISMLKGLPWAVFSFSSVRYTVIELIVKGGLWFFVVACGKRCFMRRDLIFAE
jgi:hypothetical protein